MAEGELRVQVWPWPVGQCVTCTVEPGSVPGIGRRVQAHTGLLLSVKARAKAKAEAAPWGLRPGRVRGDPHWPTSRATEAGSRQGPRPCALSTAVSSVHPGFCLEKSRPSLRPLRPDCVHHGCLQGLPGLRALNLNSALAPSLHSPGDSPGQRSHMKPCPFKSAPNRTKMATGRLTPCLA